MNVLYKADARKKLTHLFNETGNDLEQCMKVGEEVYEGYLLCSRPTYYLEDMSVKQWIAFAAMAILDPSINRWIETRGFIFNVVSHVLHKGYITRKQASAIARAISRGKVRRDGFPSAYMDNLHIQRIGDEDKKFNIEQKVIPQTKSTLFQ